MYLIALMPAAASRRALVSSTARSDTAVDMARLRYTAVDSDMHPAHTISHCSYGYNNAALNVLMHAAFVVVLISIFTDSPLEQTSSLLPFKNSRYN